MALVLPVAHCMPLYDLCVGEKQIESIPRILYITRLLYIELQHNLQAI